MWCCSAADDPGCTSEAARCCLAFLEEETGQALQQAATGSAAEDEAISGSAGVSGWEGGDGAVQVCRVLNTASM